MIGSQLGPYRILARLGEGGMGRVLASLNHPNIAHLNGVEDAAGSRAIVMDPCESTRVNPK